MDKSKLFRTKDLGFASALHCLKVPLRIADKDPERKGIVWFLFDNKPKCIRLQTKYMDKKLLVDARSFVDSQRLLKDMIFSPQQ